MVDNPLKDRDAFFQEIRESINERLTAQNLSNPPDWLYDWILSEVFQNYRILPTQMQVDYARVSELAQVISQFIHGEEVDPGNIQAESLLRQLASNGWTIIPPQT